AAAQEQEFAAIQTDAAGAVVARDGKVVGLFGVGGQADVDAVAGAGGGVGQGGQTFAFAGGVARPLPVARQVLRGRVHDDFAAFSVEQDEVVVADVVQCAGDPDQHRQVEVAGHDGTVRIGAAADRDRAQQAASGQAGHVTRRDGFGDQDLAYPRGQLAFFAA